MNSEVASTLISAQISLTWGSTMPQWLHNHCEGLKYDQILPFHWEILVILRCPSSQTHFSLKCFYSLKHHLQAFSLFFSSPECPTHPHSWPPLVLCWAVTVPYLPASWSPHQSFHIYTILLSLLPWPQTQQMVTPTPRGPRLFLASAEMPHDDDDNIAIAWWRVVATQTALSVGWMVVSATTVASSLSVGGAAAGCKGTMYLVVTWT